MKKKNFMEKLPLESFFQFFLFNFNSFILFAVIFFGGKFFWRDNKIEFNENSHESCDSFKNNNNTMSFSVFFSKCTFHTPPTKCVPQKEKEIYMHLK